MKKKQHAIFFYMNLQASDISPGNSSTILPCRFLVVALNSWKTFYFLPPQKNWLLIKSCALVVVLLKNILLTNEPVADGIIVWLSISLNFWESMIPSLITMSPVPT